MTFWKDPNSLVPKQQHRWVISFSQKNLNQTSLNDGDGFIPKWFAKSVDKPSYEIKNVQAKYLFSHTFNFPTRPIWKPITITFYDIILKEGRINYFNKPIIVDNEIVEKNDADDAKQRYSTQAFFYKFLQDAGYFSPEELEEPDSLVRMRKYNFKKNMIDAFTGRPETSYNRDFIYSGGKKLNNSTLNWTTLDISELLPDGEIAETWKLYNALISDVKFDKLDYSGDNVLTVTVTVNYDWAELVGDRSVKALRESLDSLNAGKILRPSLEPSEVDLKGLNPVDLSSPTDTIGGSRGQAVDPKIASRRLSADIGGGRVSPSEFAIDAAKVASSVSLSGQGLTKIPTTSAQVLQSYFTSQPSYSEAVQNRQRIFESVSTNEAAASRRAETRLASDLQAQQNNSPRRAVSSSPPDPSSGNPVRGSTLPKID